MSLDHRSGVTLRECPFCGRDNACRREIATGGFDSIAAGAIVCPICHARGPQSTSSWEEAISGWNRRSAPEPPQDSPKC